MSQDSHDGDTSWAAHRLLVLEWMRRSTKDISDIWAEVGKARETLGIIREDLSGIKVSAGLWAAIVAAVPATIYLLVTIVESQ